MSNHKQTTGNTGEWSELYALGFLLANGGAYGADKDQNRKDDLFYKVLKIIFAEKFLFCFSDQSLTIISKTKYVISS